MSHDQPLYEVALSIGQFVEHWGFRSIHGQTWSIIFLSRSPISLQQITQRLKISKGVAHTALNELIDYGIIEKCERSNNQKQMYQARSDIGSIIKNILKERELKIIKDSEKSIEVLTSFSTSQLLDLSLCPDRLKILHNLTKAHKLLLVTFVNKKLYSLPDWFKVLKSIKQLIKSS